MALGIATGGRRVDLGGCFDFRDVGGYRTADGSRTRWRCLFRSDGLHRLTAAGQKDLAALGLASVIDLRTAEEVAEEGEARTPATTYHLPMAQVLPAPPGHGCHAEVALIAESYFAALTDCFEVVREILAVLTDRSSYPAVVCCSSGIDRTGIVSALLLSLLGVPDDVVVGDYAASRESVLQRIGRLRFEHPSVVRPDVDRFGPGLLGVVPEAMARMLARVRAARRLRRVDRHGGRRALPPHRPPQRTVKRRLSSRAIPVRTNTRTMSVRAAPQARSIAPSNG